MEMYVQQQAEFPTSRVLQIGGWMDFTDVSMFSEQREWNRNCSASYIVV